MADTTSHSAYPAWAMYWGFVTGNALVVPDPLAAFIPDSEQIIILNCIVFGSFLPDVPAEFCIWNALYRRFRHHYGWDVGKDGWYRTIRKVASYDAQMTRNLEILRSEGSWALVFYDYMGSVVGLVTMIFIFLVVFGFASFYAATIAVFYGLHILVDYLMHPDARPFYPLTNYNPFTCRKPWWEWRSYRLPLFQLPVYIPGYGTQRIAPSAFGLGLFAGASGTAWLSTLNVLVFVM